MVVENHASIRIGLGLICLVVLVFLGREVGMMMKKEETVTQISAKLNPLFDSELMEDIKKIPKRERSYTYREALKKYFKDKKEVEGK